MVPATGENAFWAAPATAGPSDPSWRAQAIFPFPSQSWQRPDMCGIAGIVAVEGLDQDAPRRAVAMRDILMHRGPDEAGLRCDAHAVLAHRRLSIVDLRSGQQPLANEDETVWVVFNGEIYNHAEVRRDLERDGHRYRTKSDTETIVHAYEQWGEACVDRFRGMFAFALWDSSNRRLLLVRDRLGIKPLYWALAGDTLLFGSEIKALLASGLIEPQVNDDALPEALGTRYVSGTGTLFRGIQKLLPGHLLVFQQGGIRVRQYWDVPVDRPKRERHDFAGKSCGFCCTDDLAEPSSRSYSGS